MSDTFYARLNFYRLLHAGGADLPRLAQTLRVSVRTLKRWKESYDPDRIAAATLSDDVEGDPSAPGRVSCDGDNCAENAAQAEGEPPQATAVSGRMSDRDEILKALRREALDGNVQAAKLLLAEYEGSHTGGEDEALTVEQAVELLREWSKDRRPATPE
jgi:hypothetical protein